MCHNHHLRGKMLVSRMWQGHTRLGTVRRRDRDTTRVTVLKLKSQNHGNKAANNEAHRRDYALGGGDSNPDSNVVTGTFLLNNRYAYILFDSGANRIFVSTTFSSLINITPTALDISYTVELADGRVVGCDTIIRGCTLNFHDHPFNINIMPIELGSFDVIIQMDWLSKYHDVIVCDEKIVRIPYGNKILTIRGNKNNVGSNLRLNIISCIKTQKYIQKGWNVFLAQVLAKKMEDRSKEERLEGEDIPNTAFRNRYGYYEFQVMHCGLTNASTVFMGLINQVCKSYLDKFVIVFIDEILIYSKRKEEHKENLKFILELLKKEQLYAKFLKCEFWLPKLQFLGHMSDSKCIHVDPTKIDSIKD
nr:reverse transcriptase domain-containing protein [Tanacetum cinerariifolium]